MPLIVRFESQGTYLSTETFRPGDGICLKDQTRLMIFLFGSHRVY